MRALVLLLSSLAAVTAPAYALDLNNLRESVIQSPQGWRLVGINRNAMVFWIQPASVQGDAANRSVLKISVDPGNPTNLSRSRIYFNCPAATQVQVSVLNPLDRTKPLTINQGSVWETIGRIVCPPGTYGSAATGRPQAPLK
jgi:hypothetical protein